MNSYIQKVLFAALIALVMAFSAGVSAAGYGMQERIHKRISIIYKLMGEKKYDVAIQRLDNLLNTVKNLPYEKGVVLQLYGYVYSQKGDTGKAISYFKQCLELKSLPEDSLQNVRLNIIQLYIDNKAFGNASQIYSDWKNIEPRNADGYALGGMLFALQKRFGDAEQELSTAIKLGKPAKEEWLQALLSIYLDSKQYAKAEKLLDKLVVINPGKKEYWVQLADVNYLLKNNNTAASVLDVASQKNYLDSSDEIKKQAAFHYYSHTPLIAANLIKKLLEEKKLKPTAEHYKLLAYYYLQAKEYDAALVNLNNALKMGHDPALQYTIAQLYAEQQKWDRAASTIESVLKIKDFAQRDRAALLSAVVYFEKKKYTKALESLKYISYDSGVYQEAINWKKYIEAMIKSGY